MKRFFLFYLLIVIVACGGGNDSVEDKGAELAGIYRGQFWQESIGTRNSISVSVERLGLTRIRISGVNDLPPYSFEVDLKQDGKKFTMIIPVQPFEGGFVRGRFPDRISGSFLEDRNVDKSFTLDFQVEVADDATFNDFEVSFFIGIRPAPVDTSFSSTSRPEPLIDFEKRYE